MQGKRNGLEDLFKGTVFQKNGPKEEEVLDLSANILNVGQANYIQIKNGAEDVLTFDMGYPKKDFLGDSECKKISDCNIISHWDGDHYRGYRDLGDEAFRKKWIVPSGLLAKRLEERIINERTKESDSKADICIVSRDDDKGKLIYSNKCDNPRFEIWMGDGNDINGTGLIIRINNTLFPGDCIYKHWPDNLQDDLGSITQLIVPHHCCSIYDASIDKETSVDKEPEKTNKNIAIIKKMTGLEKCIICCGEQAVDENGKRICYRLNLDHLDYLTKLKNANGANIQIEATGGNLTIEDVIRSLRSLSPKPSPEQERRIRERLVIKNKTITLKPL